MSEPWFDARHEATCASQERLPDPGPEGEGAFDERGWYHPLCDCMGCNCGEGERCSDPDCRGAYYDEIERVREATPHDAELRNHVVRGAANSHEGRAS